MLATPTLIIDKDKVEENIFRMSEKAKKSNVIFRPHFKTHQSLKIGELFRELGIHKITVSSVSMAMFFASNGWNDITIAFPVNLREVVRIDKLASQIKLNLLVDSLFTTKQLSESLTNNVSVFIEVDNGYHRSGCLADATEEIDDIVDTIDSSDRLNFSGFLTHAGNTYSAKGKSDILQIMDDASSKLHALKQKYIDRFPHIISSYGDTPSCGLAEDLGVFDEIRPGNFVYYDVMQYHIGSCKLEDIAVAIACPVVSVYPEREELVIYGGAVHLSKEFIAADNDFKLFGYVVELDSTKWNDPIPGAYVSSISQEHGIVKMPSQIIKDFKPGDIIGVLPIHSCLTADLLRKDSTLI